MSYCSHVGTKCLVISYRYGTKCLVISYRYGTKCLVISYHISTKCLDISYHMSTKCPYIWQHDICQRHFWFPAVVKWHATFFKMVPYLGNSRLPVTSQICNFLGWSLRGYRQRHFGTSCKNQLVPVGFEFLLAKHFQKCVWLVCRYIKNRVCLFFLEVLS